MDKKERLLALIDHFANGNKTQFAGMIGVSPQGLSTWISRDTFDTERIYSKCVNVSPHWLLTGEGPMLKAQCDTKGETHTPAHLDGSVSRCKGSENQANTQDNLPSLSSTPNIGTPYYDVDFLGGFDEVFSDQTTIPFTNIVIKGFEKADLWCNVTGHSMEPKICHGDIIALRRCRIDDIQYGEIYAVVLDTIRTIKIIRRASDPRRLRFVPINTNSYDEQEFDMTRIIHIYEVVGSISKFF